MLTPRGARNYRLRRTFLRSVLASQMRCLPGDINIQYSANGKPFVADGPAFNLSHCEQLVVVAVSNNDFAGQVGVDVESRKKDPDILRLADKCFTRLERTQLAKYRSQVSQLSAFTRGWTRKEAIAKANGMGLRIPFDSFDVSLESKALIKQHRSHTEPHLLSTPRLDYVSTEFCELYDLGSRLSCEVSLAVLHPIATRQTTVRVVDVDEHLLNTLGVAGRG